VNSSRGNLVQAEQSNPRLPGPPRGLRPYPGRNGKGFAGWWHVGLIRAARWAGRWATRFPPEQCRSVI
jgi:hypothetical protein